MEDVDAGRKYIEAECRTRLASLAPVISTRFYRPRVCAFSSQFLAAIWSYLA